MEKHRIKTGRLTHAEKAWIPEPKLKDYVLNPDHRVGGRKARLFGSLLGIGRDDWEYLRDQILIGIRTAPAGAWVYPPYGIEYEVVVSVAGRNGQTHPVLTAWLLDDTRAPHLTSARVLIRGGHGIRTA